MELTLREIFERYAERQKLEDEPEFKNAVLIPEDAPEFDEEQVQTA